MNDTFITLITKLITPLWVGEYKLINLCNIVYKIVAKVLANKLKLILPDLISLNHSAFVLGRLITNNIIIAYETLHSQNSQSHGQNSYMTLKLDMNKVYDRVEWLFLEAVMCKISFHTTWVKLIMLCVRSVLYSILVNGTFQPSFKPCRGIRQEDLLFPYLLIISAEVLSCMLNKTETNWDYHQCFHWEGSYAYLPSLFL